MTLRGGVNGFGGIAILLIQGVSKNAWANFRGEFPTPKQGTKFI
jgi:hypothetical protein